MLLEIQLSIGEGWNPIKGFSPAICFVPVTSQDLDFQHHMSWFFCVQLVQLRWELVFSIVDIGIDDVTSCLNFLFVSIHLYTGAVMVIITW
jgi:hypothetical protein